MRSLSVKEKEILTQMEEAFKYFTEEEKERLYYFGLGLTFQGNRKE